MRLLTLIVLTACAPRPADSNSDPEDTDASEPAVSDADGDGFGADDCDDTDAERFPGASERCNGVDDDCDGAPAAGEADEDGDDTPDCADCADAGFWPEVSSVPTADLIDHLREATEGVDCSYSRAREYMFTELDFHDGGVNCVYTGKFFSITDYPPDWGVVNTEHTWPQSEGADEDPAQCDLHHLFPADAEVNGIRSSLPFGNVTSTDWTGGGSAKGKDSSGTTVFEPRDVHKGDVARAMLYFAVHYDYPVSSRQYAIYREWHDADPPTDAELARNLLILDQQGNANPFVACPELVQRLDEI